MNEGEAPLVVNASDCERARSRLGRALERGGFRVLAASTAGEALALAGAALPDAVVVAGELPDLAAEALGRALRANPATAATFFVRASPLFSDAARRAEALEAGADACLGDPAEPAELVAALRALLRRGEWAGDARGRHGRVRAAFDAVGDALYVVDPAGLLVECNRAGLALLGRDAEGTLGRPFDEVAAPRLAPLERLARAAGAAGARGREVCAGGRWFRASAGAMVGPGGEAGGVVLGLADVTAQRRAREELVRLHRAADASARAKDEFLATLSHEMRTPLNAVLGWLHLLRTGALEGDARERALATIERNARQQARLIDDVLDVARIVAGKLTLELGELRFDELVCAAAESLRPAAEAKGVALAASIEGELAPLVGDAERLEQVVVNLVSNAIKFTGPGGHVGLTLRAEEGGGALLAVTDDGAGIAPEFLPHVFDRFRQEDGSPTREYKGLGIGLSLVRHFVGLHGGEVRAESAGPGRGASFVVRLPRVAAYGRGAVAAAPTRRPAGAGGALRGLRVLVVDDDPDARELVAKVLEASGAAVEAATTAAAALSALMDAPPDVLVSDVRMPGEDGLSLVRKVRALGHAPPALVAVALTGLARREDGRRALEAGFDQCLRKPFEPDELVGAVLAARGDAGDPAPPAGSGFAADEPLR